MNLKSKSKAEQLDIAKSTTCPKELKMLFESPYMNVRRAVARNIHICTEVANELVHDPVLNVSYMAFQNPNSTLSRNFCEKIITSCVVCEKDEREVDCTVCENKNKTLLND